MPAIDFDNQLMKQEKVLQCLISLCKTTTKLQVDKT